MTTVQIKSGSASATINGENLLVSLSGLFKVSADGDHVTLEPAAARQEARSPVFGPPFPSAYRFELGEHFWSGPMESDHAKPAYRVSLFRLRFGRTRGTCRCDDWQFQGLGQGDLLYRCKHIERAIRAQSVRSDTA